MNLYDFHNESFQSGLPELAAYVGARTFENRIAAWRWTLGASGAVLLGLILFIGSGFVETAYYNYIFYSRAKAGKNHIFHCAGGTSQQKCQSRAFWLDRFFLRSFPYPVVSAKHDRLGQA
jgi:hypothetical protein